MQWLCGREQDFGTRGSGPKLVKLFMLSSAETKMYPADKC